MSDHVGDLLIGLVAEQSVGDVRVELLEHVRLQLGVGVDDVEDLLALGVRSVFEQVGDLSGLELDDPAEGGAGADTGRVADEGFEGFPVLAGTSTSHPDEPEQPGWAAGVQAGHNPSLVTGQKLHVPGPYQLGVSDIDEPMAQDVFPQQNLAVSALKSPKIDLGFGKHNAFFAQFRHPLHRYEHPAPADFGHESCRHWVVLSSQTDNDVVDLANAFIGRREEGPTQQSGQVHIGTVTNGAELH